MKRIFSVVATVLMLVSGVKGAAADDQVRPADLEYKGTADAGYTENIDFLLRTGEKAPGHNWPKRHEKIDSFSKAISLETSSAPAAAAQAGAAVMASLVLHELGHAAVADSVGAQGVSVNFFKKQDGKFFLATATYKSVDSRSQLPITMAGEVGADLTFEYALKSYREDPNFFNKSLLVLSGLDFVRYCAYSYYMTDGHRYYDPIGLSNQTGFSRDAIFAVAVAKTMVNAYRVYSGNDYLIPYFAVDRYSATVNVSTTF